MYLNDLNKKVTIFHLLYLLYSLYRQNKVASKKNLHKFCKVLFLWVTLFEVLNKIDFKSKIKI